MSWESILKEENIKTEFKELEDMMIQYNLKCDKIESELLAMHSTVYKKTINFVDKHLVKDEYFDDEVKELFDSDNYNVNRMNFEDILPYMRKSVEFFATKEGQERLKRIRSEEGQREMRNLVWADARDKI